MLDTRTLLEEIKTLSAIEEPDEEEVERLAALDWLRGEVRGDWNEGITLIRESEWEDFCRETAVDAGFIQGDSPLGGYVDWGNWADAMRSDYYSIEFDGDAYFYRAY